ncbi:MAG: hypothetical protein ACUVRR_07870 [Candidatus Fervidibacter sp.]|uniref:hypothetical protein n=1 Tax=Candidatus Fervidibacter sp. TaxID=3100871 RepID=UPI0040494A15
MVRRFQKLTFLFAVALMTTHLLSVSLHSPPTSFATLTVAIPSVEIPLPLQMVLAYGLQIQASKKAIGYPWWTLGGFGVTFATDLENVSELKETILRVWGRQDWDPLTVRQARSLSSQQIRDWVREPEELMKWRARISAIESLSTPLDPEQPNRIGLDDIAEVMKKLSRYEPPVLFYALDTKSLSFEPMPFKPIKLRQGFRLTFRLTSSQRAHALWWMVTRGDPAVAMVVGELLGGGTGAKWFQLLRGNNPIAYHAIAQLQWTPVGSELTLYAAVMPEDLKLARRKAQRLLSDLRSGRVDSLEVERAKRIAELKLKQITSDPISLSKTMVTWLMSGRSLSDWENLPKRLRSLTEDELVAFCRSLPQATEVVATP